MMPKYISSSIEETISKMNLRKSILVCGLSYKANVEDMRDSPSFKIMTELAKIGFKVYGYDPFFNDLFTEKYLIENRLKEKTFTMVDNLGDDELKEIDCMCIVQHHEKTQNELVRVYEEGKIPFIYDCQNKLKKIETSKTILKSFGT